MRWILLSTLFAAPCLAGEPPFSHIRRKPSLSPYVRLDEQAFMPYQLEVLPNMEVPAAQPPRAAQRPPRPVMPQTQGIRPTGHPTYFMILP
jgi:hypothetical protein